MNNVINSRKSSGEFRYLEESQPEEIQPYATIDGHEVSQREFELGNNGTTSHFGTIPQAAYMLQTADGTLI